LDDDDDVYNSFDNERRKRMSDDNHLIVYVKEDSERMDGEGVVCHGLNVLSSCDNHVIVT
jgi:hypothetical protein